MADAGNPFPFNESSVFPWLKTAADMWLNMAKTIPPDSDTTLKTQTDGNGWRAYRWRISCVGVRQS